MNRDQARGKAKRAIDPRPIRVYAVRNEPWDDSSIETPRQIAIKLIPMQSGPMTVMTLLPSCANMATKPENYKQVQKNRTPYPQQNCAFTILRQVRIARHAGLFIANVHLARGLMEWYTKRVLCELIPKLLNGQLSLFPPFSAPYSLFCGPTEFKAGASR